MNEIKSVVKQGESFRFFDKLDTIIKVYIGEKLNIPPSSLTSLDVEYNLKKHNIKSKNILFVTEILKLCEQSQFSTFDNPKKKVEIAYKDTLRIIKAIDKEIKN